MQSSLFDSSDRLFASHDRNAPNTSSPNGAPTPRPLAFRMRPTTLDEVVGHEALIGETGPLRRLVQANAFTSLVFWGPPGCGKTSLASVIANTLGARLILVNAVTANLAQLRDTLALARADYANGRSSIVLIDEIHRFNRGVQDILLPDLESGEVRLIGLTTYHPGHYLIPALLSRSHLFRLEALKPEDVVLALGCALTDVDRGLGKHGVTVAPGVLESISTLCEGDLRRALSTLETLVLSHVAFGSGEEITLEHLKLFNDQRITVYDRDQDEHYDTISAFIKSVRGSDPDAALYWLAKMLLGGEDPRFIARRLVILASEDIGLANPHALPLAMAAFQACEVIGLPECELHLAHVTCFLALSPKSNASYKALGNAKRAHKELPKQAVPLWLRDSSAKVAKQAGYGQGYQYSHDCPGAFSGQEYMEKPLTFYTPTLSGAEAAMAERLAQWKSIKSALQKEGRSP